MLTLGIDQERLGYARPDKIYVELEDTKRPKNVLKFDKDIPYKDGEISKTGTIDSPDVIVINDTDPVDDFDGPVLKDIKLEKFMYEDSETICKKSCFQHGF